MAGSWRAAADAKAQMQRSAAVGGGQWQTWTWNVQVESMFRIAASTSRLSRSTGPESGGRRHRARGSNALLWPAGGQRCRVPSASVRGMGVVLAEALRLSRARKCSLMWPVWPGRVSGAQMMPRQSDSAPRASSKQVWSLPLPLAAAVGDGVPERS